MNAWVTTGFTWWNADLGPLNGCYASFCMCHRYITTINLQFCNWMRGILPAIKTLWGRLDRYMTLYAIASWKESTDIPSFISDFQVDFSFAYCIVPEFNGLCGSENVNVRGCGHNVRNLTWHTDWSKNMLGPLQLATRRQVKVINRSKGPKLPDGAQTAHRGHKSRHQQTEQDKFWGPTWKNSHSCQHVQSVDHLLKTRGIHSLS